ncbi:Trans-2-enoyl-CoA reductase, mitochondrial [Zancudomyces culisetae]|uniref:enoyl-[acyl-carrier-protein] reductase n=1 Tax=Zancudomyces culisetae TaxID=1213189 RepID=A0A1R1PJR9_ZANCU|nr:Trans-2-enoyl-CoA reductase, mitochondrial [Zancudomyces culisetae]OMH80738.1 Trans-2-enoyl-CoA reductase, mitochondrial [Zancudomyces culisetae]OMH81132.1 Trans-2-enoyl-CoA reductase, mitochondrial [Zancudomyces culisetae]|eukprot:OMH79330.1 Trans-2-enoyl-CoA reductase, mitochondrial [Zancudomyces culisetae]
MVKPEWGRAAIYTQHGNPQDVIKVYDFKLEALPEDKILIENFVAPINPSDVNVVQGVYPLPKDRTEFTVKSNSAEGGVEKLVGTIGGNESIGRVLEIGSKVASISQQNFAVGDWVMFMSSPVASAWTTHTHVSPNEVIVLKNTHGLSPTQIASIKVNASTAYRMLLDIVKLEKGDYVIQNGANSGVGQIIIQLAKRWGYHTVNVVRGRENFDQLESFLKGLGADIVVKEEDLESPEVVALLADKPVRLALDCVCGPQAMKMVKHLKPEGVIATYGGMSKQPMPASAPILIFKDITFKGYWVSKWYKKNTPAKWLEMWDDIMTMMEKGELKEQVTTPINWFSGSGSSEKPLDIQEVQNAVTSTFTSGRKEIFVFTNNY